MQHKKKVLLLALMFLALPCLDLVQQAQADRVRPERLRAWSFRAKSIWRKEVRTREIARWYRYYRWRTYNWLWLKRRAEIVWLTKASLSDFLCRTCCLYYWPNHPRGPRILKIYRTYYRADLRFFRKCYRVWWAGLANPVLQNDLQNQLVRPEIAATVAQDRVNQLDPRLRRRFCLAMDRVELGVPMIPVNDVNVVVHTFLPDGTPDQEFPPVFRADFLQNMQRQGLFLNHLPDIVEMQNELGNRGIDLQPEQIVQIATTANTLPRQVDLNENNVPDDGRVPLVELPRQDGQTGPSGIHVGWLLDDAGNVNVRDATGQPEPLLSDLVLGNQNAAGLIGNNTALPLEGDDPRLQDGGAVELPVDMNLQMQCGLVGPDGTVLGASPNQFEVIGPPAFVPPDPRDPLGNDAVEDPASAFGGLIPAVPVDHPINENPNPQALLQIEPLIPEPTGLPPLELAVEQEGEPDAEQLAVLNNQLQLNGIRPFFPPFNFCIRSFSVKRWWSCDRRVIMDTWYHYWRWTLRHHVHLTKVMHRVWVWRSTVQTFTYRRWCFTREGNSYFEINRARIRFFRACYRVFCPRPNVVRIRLDRLCIVAENPDGGLMLVCTDPDRNNLPAPAVLAGLINDPLQAQFDPDGDGVAVLDIAKATEQAAEAQTMGPGAPGVFEADLGPVVPGETVELGVLGNNELGRALNNNQLQLYCGALDDNGNFQVDSFFDVFTELAPAIPVVDDAPAVPGAPVTEGNGSGVEPTDLSLELAITDDTDFNDDGRTDFRDWPTFVANWLKELQEIPAN